jgi:sugar-specific transcriptional regulator TrmB
LEEYTATLSQFGFTNNQARVYLTIVQLGLTSVSSISKSSGVRREDVYRILPKLEQMGLIERVLGTPTKTRAIPLQEAFSILVRQRQDEVNKQLSELASRAEQFLRHFKPSYDIPFEESDEAQFSLITGKAAIISRVTDMIRKTQSEIDAISSAVKLSRFIFTYAESIREVINKSVKVKIIAEISQDDARLKKTLEDQVPGEIDHDLRYAKGSVGQYFISDNKEAIFVTSMESESLGETPILWTNNSNLIALLHKDFEDLWATSSKAKL